jgi:gas vesicle protein
MSDPNEIRNDIERTRRELGSDVDALADKVNPAKMAHRQTDKVKHAFAGMRDRVMGTASDAAHSTQGAAHSVGDSMSEAAQTVGDAVAEAPQRVRQATEGNPLAVGLIAFGVGWLAASLIPASRQEQQLAQKGKEAAAPIAGELKDAAAEAADHLREPAKDAVDAVKERATEAVDHVKEEGSSAAEDVQSDAKHTAERHMQ